jgi:hypothetical protein
MFAHWEGFQTQVAGIIMMQTVVAPTIKCGTSWDPYVMAFHVSVFFIGSLSIQRE